MDDSEYNPENAPLPLDMIQHERTERLCDFLRRFGVGLEIYPKYDKNLKLLSLSVFNRKEDITPIGANVISFPSKNETE